MNHDLLDLAAHRLDMLSGKLIVIGPAEYSVGERILESNGGWVYPLRNVKTGFSWCIGRFQRLVHEASDPGVPDALRQVDFGTFLMALSGLPVVQTETHDVPGGAVQLRRTMDAPREDAFHRELMQKGSEAIASKRWNEAGEIYSSVLHQNPNHHSAMVNLAACLLHLNDPLEALRAIVHATEVEPNDPQVHQQTAVVFRSLAMAGLAMDSLERNLKRFRWDAASWGLKAEISLQYGLATHLQQMRAEIDGFQPNHKTGLGTFIDELQSGLSQARTLAAKFTDAIEKQRQGSWTAAVEIWETIGLDHLDSLNQLNLLICKFHLGRIDEVAKESLPLLYCLPLPLHKLACAGLALIANMSSGGREHALSLGRLLSSEVSDSADLPAIPEAVFPGGEVIESRSSKSLVDALQRLGQDCSAKQDVEMLANLVELYQERERRFSKVDVPAPGKNAPRWKFW